MTDMLQWYP